mmetsp:Transcript_108694/g.232210  ORF Transcript_108694/g.232210 Transcript_108694/m.232210 type:complete len:316 (-) Transcript_108694:1345-2292(-)
MTPQELSSAWEEASPKSDRRRERSAAPASASTRLREMSKSCTTSSWRHKVVGDDIANSGTAGAGASAATPAPSALKVTLEVGADSCGPLRGNAPRVEAWGMAVKATACWVAASKAPKRRSKRAPSNLPTRFSNFTKSCRPPPPASCSTSVSRTVTRLVISLRTSSITLLIRSASSTRSSASSSPTHAAKATCSSLPMAKALLLLPSPPILLTLSPTSCVPKEACGVPCSIERSLPNTSSEIFLSIRSAAAAASSARQLTSAKAVQRSLRSRSKLSLRRQIPCRVSCREAWHEARLSWQPLSTSRSRAMSSSESRR